MSGQEISVEVPRIAVEEVKRRLDEGEQVVFIDVRKPESYTNAHIKGALSIPGKEMDERYQELPRDAALVLY